MTQVYRLFHERYDKEILGNWSSTYFKTKNDTFIFHFPKFKQKRYNKLSKKSVQHTKWHYQKNILVYISYLVIKNVQYLNKFKSKVIFHYTSWFNSSKVLSNYISIKFKNEIFIKKIMSGVLRKSKYLIKRSQMKGIRLYITGKITARLRNRSFTKTLGNLNFNTIESKLEYTPVNLQSKEGSIGLKIWILK